ncbi:MAG TPA: diguanylate cyclase [Candidatus Baltobacteraceae bacterium]|nr:diguanylate cyclase [Candidatus Baltobacteraceae bacterium]
MERTAGRRDSELVRQTAELLSIGGPLADLFEHFCVLLAQFVDASVVFIALDSGGGAHIEFAFDHGVTAREAHVPIRSESQTFRVMHSGESLLMRGHGDLPAQRIPLQIPGASVEDTASAVFVPLRFGSRPIGVLSVQSERPDAYDEHDLQLLETCALYVAVRVQAEFMRSEKDRAVAAATVDPVTGIATRRVFEERLNHEWQRARRTGGSVGVILLDIDRFKAFNDTYGHIAGDACLAQVAQAARACVSRSTDLFARYGGEEFAAILRDVPPATALGIAERMRKAIGALQIPHAQNPEGVVTASFGVAGTPPASDDVRPLLRRADRALYSAKMAGRNRAVLETPQHVDDIPHLDGNLPAFSAKTIGRTMEHDALVRSLAISRLTTVVGPGGVGKTHCALAVAHQLAHAYVHGAWFFDLSLVRDADELDGALLAALDRHKAGHRNPRDTALHYFSNKHCLIVFDNCEQVADAVGDLCAALLERAPRATILATSRETLKVKQERVFHLTPLTREDAEALFCTRAASAFPGVLFDAQEREQIREVCRQLDDIPLAIELAAPRVKTLSPAELAAALRDRFDVLVNSRRRVPERHRTLEATIAWSYALLEERAQRLFERLSIFGRTFDSDAARDICGFSPLRPGEAAAAFDEIVDKHLAAVVQMNDEERYLLLESTRAFAAQRLRERGEEQLMHARHAEYYLAFARRVGKQIHRDGADRALEAGAREWAEFRVALERSFTDETQLGTAFALVLALRGWWAESGRTREARAWIERALGGAQSGDPRRSDLLYAAALAAHSDSDFHALREYASELLALEEHTEDRVKLGRACNALGNAEKHLGNAKAAEQWYTSALAHHRAAGDRRGVGVVLMNLGAAAADLHLEFEAARAYFLEALQIFRELGLSVNVGIVLANLGEIAGHSGDYESAISYAAESLGIFERLRNAGAQAWQLVSIAHYRLERHEWERATSALRGAHALLQEHPHREYAAMLLEVGLYLACDLERHELAARIAGYLHGYREREAVPRLPSAQRLYERRVHRSRTRLGSAAFEAAYASGTSSAPDALIAEVVRP